MKMKLRVYKNILNFIKHVSSFEEECLAKDILQEQVTNKWGGLVADAMEISDNHGIDGLLDDRVTKKMFKKKLKAVFKSINEDEIKDDMNPYKKMEKMKSEESKGNH